jgi:hypothetical protein
MEPIEVLEFEKALEDKGFRLYRSNLGIDGTTETRTHGKGIVVTSTFSSLEGMEGRMQTFHISAFLQGSPDELAQVKGFRLGGVQYQRGAEEYSLMGSCGHIVAQPNPVKRLIELIDWVLRFVVSSDSRHIWDQALMELQEVHCNE